MTHDPNAPVGWTPPVAAGDFVPSNASSGEAAPTDPADAPVPSPSGTALAAPIEPSAQPPRLPAVRWGMTPTASRKAIVIGGSFDLIAAVNRVLDTLDVVGDRIAEVAGIRPPTA